MNKRTTHNVKSKPFQAFYSKSNFVAACYKVAKIISRHAKRFRDSDYITELWLEYASIFVEDFRNIDKIEQGIRSSNNNKRYT